MFLKSSEMRGKTPLNGDLTESLVITAGLQFILLFLLKSAELLMAVWKDGLTLFRFFVVFLR